LGKLKLSIIVPTFNCVSFIEDCLLSIINQSYDSKEIIIIDGGSTDGTVDIDLKNLNVHAEEKIQITADQKLTLIEAGIDIIQDLKQKIAKVQENLDQAKQELGQNISQVASDNATAVSGLSGQVSSLAAQVASMGGSH
jgi:hypothetical protein